MMTTVTSLVTSNSSLSNNIIIYILYIIIYELLKIYKATAAVDAIISFFLSFTFTLLFYYDISLYIFIRLTEKNVSNDRNKKTRRNDIKEKSRRRCHEKEIMRL